MTREVDLLYDGLVDEFEAPHATSKPFDTEKIQSRQILDSAQLDIEADFIAAVDPKRQRRV